MVGVLGPQRGKKKRLNYSGNKPVQEKKIIKNTELCLIKTTLMRTLAKEKTEKDLLCLSSIEWYSETLISTD